MSGKIDVVTGSVTPLFTPLNQKSTMCLPPHRAESWNSQPSNKDYSENTQPSIYSWCSQLGIKITELFVQRFNNLKHPMYILIPILWIGRSAKCWKLEINFSLKCSLLWVHPFFIAVYVRSLGLSMWVPQCGWVDVLTVRTSLCLRFTPLRVWRLWHHEALWPKYTSSAAQSEEGAFSVSAIIGDVKSFLSNLADVRAHLQNCTWRDQTESARHRWQDTCHLFI